MIDFSLRADHPSNTKTDVVAVAVHEGQKLSWAAQDIDKASKGALAAAVKAASFAGRAGAVLPLFNLTGVSAARVVVYGAGSGNALSAKDARATGRHDRPPERRAAPGPRGRRRRAAAPGSGAGGRGQSPAAVAAATGTAAVRAGRRNR